MNIVIHEDLGAKWDFYSKKKNTIQAAGNKRISNMRPTLTACQNIFETIQVIPRVRGQESTVKIRNDNVIAVHSIKHLNNALTACFAFSSYSSRPLYIFADRCLLPGVRCKTRVEKLYLLRCAPSMNCNSIKTSAKLVYFVAQSIDSTPILMSWGQLNHIWRLAARNLFKKQTSAARMRNKQNYDAFGNCVTCFLCNHGM